MRILNKILFHKERFSNGGNVSGEVELVYFDNKSNATEEKRNDIANSLDEAINTAIENSASGADRIEVYVNGHYVGDGRLGEFYYGKKWREKHNLPQQHIHAGLPKNQDSGNDVLKYFVPKNQLHHLLTVEPGNAKRIAKIIKEMPYTYQTDGIPLKDKIAYLHYFYGGSDWWIFERDMGDDRGVTIGEQIQAFGFAMINGDWQNAEQGYIPISEIISGDRIELDFHFEPTKFGEILAKNGDKFADGGEVGDLDFDENYRWGKTLYPAYFQEKYSDGTKQSSWMTPLLKYYDLCKSILWSERKKENPDDKKLEFVKNQVLVLQAYDTPFKRETVQKKYESGGDVEDKLYSLEVQKEPNGVWEEVNKEKMTKEEAEEMKHDYEKSGIKYHALKIDYPLFASGGEVDATLDYDKLISLYEEFIDSEHKGMDKTVMGILAQGVYSEARKNKMIARAKKATQEAIDKGRYDYKQEVYVHPKGAKTPYLEKYRVTEKFKDGGIINQYKGKSGETIWNELTFEQRRHLLADHKFNINGQVVIPLMDRASAAEKDFKDLHKNLQEIINEHVEGGQYAFGGGITDFLKKGVAGAKSGYEATRKFTEEKIHNKKKNIALDVLDETRAKVKTGKEARAVNIATSIVEHEYESGGVIKSIDFKCFTLGEFADLIRDKEDIDYWVTEGNNLERTEKQFKKLPKGGVLADNYFSIGDTGREIHVFRGNENIYADFLVYDKNNKEFTIHLYSKENHKGLKALVNSLIEKFGCGGNVGKKRKSGKKKKSSK